MNYIREYYKSIKAKKVTVGKKIKKIYEKLVYDLDHPEENIIKNYDGSVEKYIFNEKAANRPIEFIERFCKHVKGAFAGQYIKLELWQKAMISAFYGFVNKENGLRKYQRWHLYIARKNGKTLLAACLIIYEMTLGGEMGAECYSGATKRDQAKIPWDMAKLIIRKSPVLSQKFRINVSGIYKQPFSDSFYLTVSKDSKRLDGLNAHFSHIDELHAITDTNIVNVMWDSTKSRTQPIEFITTTMGTERASTFDEIYDYDSNVVNGVWNDDRLLAFCYELDDEKEWRDVKNAFKANPNLGISLSINNLAEEIEKAKNDPSRRVNLLCKSLNLRQTNQHAWLTFDQFNNTKVVDLRQFDDTMVVGGFDLSRTRDMTAFTTLLFDKKNRKLIAETMYFVTSNYVESVKKVPFELWIKQGYVRVAGTELIDYREVINYIEEVTEKYGWRYPFIGYDPYSASYLINELAALGFSKEHVLKKVRQGAKTLSVPMQELEADLKEKRISYQNNPVTKWCLSNAQVEKDRNGNYMLKKAADARKIDGVATILDCYVPYLENKEYFLGED